MLAAASKDGEDALSLYLQQLRHKLLDLTGHNKLLNFRHSESNCLRAVDELPDQLHQKLWNGKRLFFEAVPPPSEREIKEYNAPDDGVPRAGVTAKSQQRPHPAEWAQRLGIVAQYELPVDTRDVRDSKHDDDRIQTLLYPESLATRLRKLQSDAQTAIEESGVNMLYMAFGFLDWREPAKQDKACLAPLMLVPVELKKEGTREGTFRYSVAWTGEDLQTNLSLQKKLLQDFHLDLPDLENEDAPEAYFDRVRKMVRRNAAWGVRRFVTLTLFNFGKQLIYLDLDPERWAGKGPDGNAGIGGNPLVRRLLLGDDAGPSGDSGEEHPPDARVIDLDLALVDRADSTQAAALMRALTGQSMVIQGPPGTGKSQTITNLIAAALAAGKTILFVSEKLAALEVVKRRLDEMGFGPFCLELHSHKTRKQALHDSLRERLALTIPRAPGDFDRAWRELVSERDRLAEYVVQIRKPVGALAWSASRILFKAGEARRKAGALAHALKAPKDFHALDVNESGHEQALRRLTALAEAARTLSCHPKDHPWAGVSSDTVMECDVQDVVAAGRRWEEALCGLDDALCGLRRVIDVGRHPDTVVCDQARIAGDLVAVLAAVDEAFATASGLVAQVRPVLGRDLGNGIGEGIHAVGRLHAIVRLALAAPRASLASRCEELRRADVDAALSKLAETVKKACELREALDKTFRLDKAAADELSGNAARAIAASLKAGWIFGVLSAKGRKARRLAHAYSRADSGRIGFREFERYAALREIERALAVDAALRRAIGPAFAGPETDVAGLMACRSWFLALQDRLEGVSSDEARLGQALWRADPATIDFLAKLANHPGWPAVEHVWKLSAQQEAGAFCAAAAPWAPILAAACGQEFADAVVKARSSVGWPHIADSLRAVAEAKQASDQAETAFIDAAGLAEADWWQSIPPESVGHRRARIQRALAEPDALAGWLVFDRAAREFMAREAGMEAATDVARQAIAGKAPFDHIADIYEHVLFDALARAVFTTRPAVKTLGRKQHGQIRQHYRLLDERVMKLRRSRIAHDLAQRSVPPGRSGAKVGDFTDLELIKKEIGKKKRHLPIRKLVARAGSALQALKPCFMMGPLSVAQFLPPQDLSFDLVIFDEASQVRPEDAIGAIARGRQVVVVGDGNQLPPTNFFQKMNIDDADDDGAPDGEGSGGLGVVATDESILQLAESRFPRKRLLWHYRSAHESLIAFSNRSFYDGSLLIFPSPARADPGLGIAFHPIESGVFDKGRNRVEAERVAEAAAAFLRDHPERSLGVVAMNVEQTALIRELVDERMRDDPSVLLRAEDYEQQSEPFFIKNLENVQGDERDVIMISMTYGPATEGGRVMQRFGPINQNDGWRRLNVLFTRAKERMEVFSSMRAGHVLVSDKPSKGVRTLRNFLEYAETGRLEPQVASVGARPPDSDFEVAVFEGLRSLGYACDAQVGASGYFIDLAVRDPEQPGRYLLGVECDGAAYHSTPSARDRDRLRQDILEDKLGWIIERVWSTDWFRDPDAELERLRVRIEDVRSAARCPAAPMDEAELEEVELEEAELEEAEDEVRPITTTLPTMEYAKPESPGALALLERRPAGPTSGTWTISARRTRMETARRLLLDLRENEIKPAFPNTDPACGLLRKSMIDALIRTRPTTEDEFRSSIPLDLREKTDGDQLRAFRDKVFSILEQINRE